MKILLVVLIFTLSTYSFAAKKTLKSLEEKLNSQTTTINKLAAEIKHLDNEIAKTNSEYLNKIKFIEKLESKISIMKNDLKKTAAKISGDFTNSKKALNLYLLEVDDHENKDQLVHKEIYLEIFKKSNKE